VVNKYITRKQEREPEPLDESWWAAVLAEEEKHKKPSSSYTHSSSLPNNQSQANQPEVKNPSVVPTLRSASINWQLIQEAYARDETLCLQVVGFNRGGLLVEGEGLQGFVPVSHLIDIAPGKVEDESPDQADQELFLTPYMGRVMRLKVIECDPERGRIVLSERAALSEPGRRNQLLEELKPGECITGRVTNITDFGVFVDLGGIEGLIHVSELSWGRVRHPTDAIKVDQVVRAHIIQVDKERCRVALSLKRLCPNPWDTAETRYFPGQVIDAVITCVVPFGAFARLEEGLDGLIHITEMSPKGGKLNPRGMLKEGQQVQVRVLQVDASRQRLGLSLVEILSG